MEVEGDYECLGPTVNQTTDCWEIRKTGIRTPQYAKRQDPALQNGKEWKENKIGIPPSQPGVLRGRRIPFDIIIGMRCIQIGLGIASIRDPYSVRCLSQAWHRHVCHCCNFFSRHNLHPEFLLLWLLVSDDLNGDQDSGCAHFGNSFALAGLEDVTVRTRFVGRGFVS